MVQVDVLVKISLGYDVVWFTDFQEIARKEKERREKRVKGGNSMPVMCQ